MHGKGSRATAGYPPFFWISGGWSLILIFSLAAIEENKLFRYRLSPLDLLSAGGANPEL